MEENSDNEKKISRKEFVGAGILAAAGIAVASKGTGSKDKKSRNARYGMVIDLRRCTGCMSCQVACKAEFDVPAGVNKSWVEVYEQGTFPHTQKHFIPKLCNHCGNPRCQTVCPVKATYTDEKTGLVKIKDSVCIGCKSCIGACPYNMRYSDPISHTAHKCTLCEHRVKNGVVPACQNTCPAEARTFGDFNDPNSEVSKLIRENATEVLKPAAGTDPNVYYIKAPGMKDLTGKGGQND